MLNSHACISAFCHFKHTHITQRAYLHIFASTHIGTKPDITCLV